MFLVSCGDNSKRVYPENEGNDDNSAKAAGELGGECLSGKTCNEGLTCDEEKNECIENEVADNDSDNEQGDTDKDSDKDSDKDKDEDEDKDEDADTNDEDTPVTENERKADCDPKPENTVWNDNGEDGKFVQTLDGENWTPESYESTYSDDTPGVCVFKCKEGYEWKDSQCIAGPREVACTGLPENAEWNKADKITQEWDGEKWLPSNEGTYNTQESTNECRFICKENYTWQESSSTCKADTRNQECTGKPENSYWNTADEISQTWNGTAWEPSEIGTYSKEPSDTQCFFICKSGLTYDESTSTCAGPCDKCATAEHALGSEKCIETASNEYSCECEKPYFWDGTKCKMMPECSPAKVTPCRNGNDEDYLIWSKKASETMRWANAQTYCDELTEGGFNDWRLPNIDELRTLILSCPDTMPGGSCAVTDPDCLSLNSCYTDAT